jgi:hypothetical protein
MPLVVKQRIVHGALLLLALWPLAHLALVARDDLSPWKLAGWGMYTTPRFGMLGMEVFGRARAGDDWQQLVAPTPATRDAATAFLERHRWLRRLASSDALVAAVYAEQPAWREVRIVVSYPVLDRTTSRVRLATDERLVTASAADR